MTLAAVVPLVASLLLAASSGATSAKRAPRPGSHPATGGDQECARCHAQATPASFQAWQRSKHGEVLVTCVVCHGSTGGDFTRVPTNDRCAGCHAEQLQLAGKFAKGKSCFACHGGHELSPHGRGDGATANVREVTKTDLSSVAFPDHGVQSVPLAIQPSPPPGAQPAAQPAPAPTPSGAPDPARNVPATPAVPAQPQPPATTPSR